MGLVIEHIQYLLQHHQKVTLEGCGTFTVQRHSAQALPSSNGVVVILPPEYIVLFDAQPLTNDDGLLVRSLQRREGIDADQARQLVRQEVRVMRLQLKVRGKLTVGTIGVFTLASDTDAYVWHPCENSIVNYPNWGLPTLHLHKIRKRTRLDVDMQSRALVAQARMRRLTWQRVAAWSAAAIIAAILLVTGLLPAAVRQSPTLTASTSSLNLPRRLTIGLPQEGPIELVLEESKPDNSAPISGTYYLIVASFPTQVLAEKFITDERYGEGIIHSDGRWRVYAASATSPDALAAAKSECQNHEAWVLRQ